MAKRRRNDLLEVVLVAAAAQLVALGPTKAEDDSPRAPITQKPQSQAASTNAKQAIGSDEVDGPTILEGVSALNSIDAIRDALRDRYGIYIHGLYLGDPYANLGGGLQRGTTYSGRLDVQLDIDANKVAGVPGGTFHANFFQIHGRDLSRDYVGNFLSTNDVAALPTTRLFELWYEHKFGDKLTLRAGQQGIDVEFLTSNYAGNFINATFGWPGLTSQDLPDGGPAYPLATPAVRLKFDPTESVSILAAVLDGEPAGPCSGDPQTCDRYGLNFRVSDPPLIFLESQYRYNQSEDARGLPGTLKVGAFAHFGRFPDQSYGTDGLSLGSGSSNGIPIAHSPDVGLYGVVDQQIYRLHGDDPEKGIGAFARLIVAPADRNPVDLYVDGGFSALGLVPGRPNDLFGVAGALARTSPAATGGDIDAASRIAAAVPSFEAVIEATYQIQVIPGIAVQPTFQYIIHPGGNIANPYNDGITPIRNATVFGVTTAIRC